MTQILDFRPLAYLIVLLGLGGAAAASVVPFYTAGYVLEPGVLLAVLMPFLLYGLFTESLRSAWLIASGLMLLAISLALVVPERFLHYNGYTDDMIYWVPTLAAVIVLPIAYRLGRRKDDADSP
jgi:NADH:ubiquinone oxidoreductase subunit K